MRLVVVDQVWFIWYSLFCTLHLQRRLAMMYYYNETAKTKKIGKYDNNFAAGRVRRDIGTVFPFCPDSTFHSFCAAWYNIPNKANKLFYSNSILSPANIHWRQDQTVVSSIKCRENMLSKKKRIYKRFHEYNATHQEDVISQGVTTVGQLSVDVCVHQGKPASSIQPHSWCRVPLNRHPLISYMEYWMMTLNFPMHSPRNMCLNLWLLALFSFLGGGGGVGGHSKAIH